MSGPAEIKCCHGVVVVHPGDRVIVAVDTDFDFEQAQTFAKDLDNIELVFVHANSIAVERGAKK